MSQRKRVRLRTLKKDTSENLPFTNEDFKSLVNNFPYEYTKTDLSKLADRLPKSKKLIRKKVSGRMIIRQGLATEEEMKGINPTSQYVAPYLVDVDARSDLWDAHKRGRRTAVLQYLKKWYENHVDMMNLKNESNGVNTFFIK